MNSRISSKQQRHRHNHRRRATTRSSSHITALLLAITTTTFVITTSNAGWVDPDTPEEYLTVKSLFEEDEREYELVRSFVVAVVKLFVFLVMIVVYTMNHLL
jgi:hypothetical protein